MDFIACLNNNVIITLQSTYGGICILTWESMTGVIAFDRILVASFVETAIIHTLVLRSERDEVGRGEERMEMKKKTQARKENVIRKNLRLPPEKTKL